MTPTAMTTYRSALDDGTRRLDEAGVDNPRSEARLLLAFATDSTPEGIMAWPEIAVNPDHAARYDGLLSRREAHEPISHLVEMREFWSLPFRVTADVLTPRPDTETVVEAVLRLIGGRPGGHGGPMRILDLGTGSGCLLLALLSELPAARGLGVDRSAAALAIAAQNAESLGLSARADFAQGDWFGPVKGTFDVIVSNPPYIPSADIAALEPEVARYEPRIALDGGPDGLDCYRILVAGVGDVLRADGIVAFEAGIGQAEGIAGLIKDAGLQLIEIKSDLSGVARCVVGGAGTAGASGKKRLALGREGD
ncbi:MAG: peptide chain release factor N(5)-glutamine methyltransferase [Rhodospirillales bacterium]|nr:peptide chain release factor N(5)-glutamine methyltransferase [Rhodospirillales bacterium]MCW9040628.1 peptide chain release factor N(5)-glutamine methyltransferase [Rhodospirillales bacterium]